MSFSIPEEQFNLNWPYLWLKRQSFFAIYYLHRSFVSLAIKPTLRNGQQFLATFQLRTSKIKFWISSSHGIKQVFSKSSDINLRHSSRVRFAIIEKINCWYLFSCLTSSDFWIWNTQRRKFACENTENKSTSTQSPIHEPVQHSNSSSRDLQLHHKMCLQFFLSFRFQRFFFRSALDSMVMVGWKNEPVKLTQLKLQLLRNFTMIFWLLCVAFHLKDADIKEQKEIEGNFITHAMTFCGFVVSGHPSMFFSHVCIGN